MWAQKQKKSQKWIFINWGASSHHFFYPSFLSHHSSFLFFSIIPYSLPFLPSPFPFLLCSLINLQQKLFLICCCRYFIDDLFIISMLENASQMGKNNNFKIMILDYSTKITLALSWVTVFLMKFCTSIYLLEIKYLHILFVCSFVAQVF